MVARTELIGFLFPRRLSYAVEQLGMNGVLVLNAREGGPAAKAGVRGSTRDEYGR